MTLCVPRCTYFSLLPLLIEPILIYQHHSINLADVYADLAYYHDYREEIRQQIEEGENFAKQLQGNKPSLIEKILNGENVKQD